MTRFARVAPALLVMSAALSACPKKPKPAPPPPAANEDSLARARARADSLAALERARADSAARADSLRAEQERMQRMLTEARNALTAVIYFDFDRAELTDQARATLDAKVPLLNANRDVRLRVAGHTDNRGSDEYNIALGQRRAAEAKRYLTQRGVDASRIDIVSFGEEHPVAQGNDESAWSQNRRDEFEITAGGTSLRMPSSSQ